MITVRSSYEIPLQRLQITMTSNFPWMGNGFQITRGSRAVPGKDMASARIVTRLSRSGIGLAFFRAAGGIVIALKGGDSCGETTWRPLERPPIRRHLR